MLLTGVQLVPHIEKYLIGTDGKFTSYIAAKFESYSLETIVDMVKGLGVAPKIHVSARDSVTNGNILYIILDATYGINIEAYNLHSDDEFAATNRLISSSRMISVVQALLNDAKTKNKTK